MKSAHTPHVGVCADQERVKPVPRFKRPQDSLARGNRLMAHAWLHCSMEPALVPVCTLRNLICVAVRVADKAYPDGCMYHYWESEGQFY